MAGTERPDRPERRRFITHRVRPGDPSESPGRRHQPGRTTTRGRPRRSIERDGAEGVTLGSSTTSASAGPSAVGPVARGRSAADLRHAVRAAVLAQLGSEPPGLDAVIDRVLKSRSR